MNSETKKIYQFTLVLRNVDEKTPGLEDSLYNAGCDDALMNFRDGTVYLDFDSLANSLEEAVMCAIRRVEATSVGAIVVNVAPEDWVTESEVAKRLICKRQTISLWGKEKRRKSFPRPMMKLANRSPFWKWREIVEWLYQNKLIDCQEVENAIFMENVNAALGERDPRNQEKKQELLKKFSSFHSNQKQSNK